MTKQQKRQIQKFQLYGFLKNLQFFEPFLYMYLLLSDIDLFRISILISVRFIIVYVFEIPSGVFADRYGKKTELITCFIFYIISFILFFIGGAYVVFILAMVAFGLGEALRTGTHKAMIMDYLDVEQLKASKGEIYGRTRSFSLIGSTITGLLGILFIFITPEIRYLFLLAIIPFVLDIILIASYPSYMNKCVDCEYGTRDFFKSMLGTVYFAFREKELRGLIFSSSFFEAWFKAIKGYLQIILVSLGILLFTINTVTAEENLAIHLGLFYAAMTLLAAIASRNAYRIKPMLSDKAITTYVWLPAGLLMLFLGIYIESIYVVFGVFLLVYPLFNIRKPLMIELLGESMEKDKRATILSIESQLSTLLVGITSPILGYVATNYSLSMLFVVMGIGMAIYGVIYVLIGKKELNLQS